MLLIAVFLTLVPSSSTRDSSLLGQSYDIVMTSADRLRERDEVKVAGVSAGHVLQIDFTTPEQKQKFGDDANVVLHIITDIGGILPGDSFVSVNTSTTGCFWLEISPGLSNVPLENGAMVRLRPGIYSNSSLSADTSAFERLKDISKGFAETLQSAQVQASIRDLASNARFYSNELRLATADMGTQKKKLNDKLDSYQESIEQQLDRIDVQIEQSQAKLAEMRPRVHESTAAFQERLKHSSDSVQKMVETAQRETQRLQAMSDKAAALRQFNEDPAYREKLHKVSHKLENLANTTTDIHSITKDPSVGEGLQQLVHQYRTQSETIKDKFEKVEKAIPEMSTPE